MSVRAPIWGTRPDLFEVLELARSGAITVNVEPFGLEDGPTAYERLRARIAARAGGAGAVGVTT